MADWFTENAPDAPATKTPPPVQPTLDLISKYESGNRNVPNYRFDPGHTAQGYYQITNTNWNQIAPVVGIDTSKYPSAMSAPRDVQAKVASYLLTETPAGIHNWSDFNPQLRAALNAAPAAGEADRSAPPPETPTPVQPTPSPAQPTAAQAASGVDDILARIGRGENVNVTPEMIMQVAFGDTGRTAPAVLPAPPAAAPVQPGDWFATNAPKPSPPPPQQPPALERAWNAFTGSSGLQTLGGLSSAFPALAGRISGMPDYANEQRFKNTVSGLYQGIVGEPARIVEENRKAADALVKGDLLEAADHIAFMIPFLGAAGAQLKDYLEKKDYAGAIGHAAGILGAAGVSTPEGRATIAAAPGAVADVAAKVPEAISNIPGAVADAAPAVTQFVKAAAPDVAKGGVKMAAGTVIAKTPIPEVLKFGTGLPLASSGAKQIISGIKKGWAAAKEAAPEAEAAAAAPEAAAAPAAATAAPFQSGEFVQWQSQGIDQFQQPRRITGFSPDGRYAFVEGTNTGIPVEQLTRQEPAAAAAPPSRGPIITPPPADTSFVRAVPAQYPEVEPGFTPATPAPAAPGLSFDDLARALTNGKSPSSLTDAERATVQSVYNRISAGPVEPPPPARALSQEEAARLFPDAFRETPATPPATEPVPAAPSPPVAPEPAAPTLATPSPPEAPAGAPTGKPKAAVIAQQLEEMTRTNRIAEFLKANWGELTPADIDKFDAHDWELIGKGAGGAAPTPEQIGEIRASAAGAAAPVPPEVNKMPPAQAEAAVAPKLRKPPASAPQAAAPPPGQPPAPPKSLAEMMAGIPERPELEKLDFAQVTRARNVERLYDTMKEAGITPEMADAEGDAGWAALAKKAKIGPKGKPYVPSETTRAQLRQRFAESGRTQ